MKKFLLTVLSVVLAVCAFAEVSLEKPVTYEVPGTLADGKNFNATAITASNGRLIGTGAYDQDFTYNGKTYEALGTGAFLTDGKFLVTLKGAATIKYTAVTETGDIYIAGTLADVVEFGSADGKTVELEGAGDGWGGFSTDQIASFIAHYDADGNIVAAKSFAASALPVLLENPEYFALDPQVFDITGLKVAGGKVYAAAVYTGHTEAAGLTFDGTYNDPWWGMMFFDLKAAAVFSLDGNLENGTMVATCAPAEPEATEDDQYQALGATLAVDAEGANVWAIFTGNGPLKVADTTLESTAATYNNIIAHVGATGTQVKAVAAANPGYPYVFPVDAFYNEKLTILGWQSYEVEGVDGAESTIEYRTYCCNDGVIVYFDQKLETAANISYYKPLSAAMTADGNLLAVLAGYYTDAVDGEHSLNDFAGATGCFAIELPICNASAQSFAGAYPAAVATNGAYVAAAGAESNGYKFYSFTDGNAGVENVSVAADENAPVEYFNLQGVRVANPAAGLYIRRQGATATKVIL